MDLTGTYDTIVLLTNGAIGDSLMGALCADSAAKKLDVTKIIVVVPRNAALLRDLFSAYHHIRVYEVHRRNFFSAVNVAAQMIGRKNLVVSQGVFKKIPLSIQLFSHLLTMHRGSAYLHFAQKDALDKHEEKGAVVFDYRLPVYENLVRLFNTQDLNVAPSVPPYQFVRDQTFLKRYGLTRSAYLVVHPCAFSPVRSLPPERWRKIFTYVSNNYPYIKIIVTGSKQDNRFIQEIIGTGVPTASISNLAGKLSMTELANLLDGARGYIGVDTGITHLAGVLQKRSVIIGNLSNPCWLPRYNTHAVILTESKYCTCDGEKGGDCFYHIGRERYYRCMLDIPEKLILECIKDMLTEVPTV